MKAKSTHQSLVSLASLIATLVLALPGCVSTPSGDSATGGVSIPSVSIAGVSLAGVTPSNATTTRTVAGDSDELEADERELRRRSRNFNRTIIEGAAYGAAAGALIGLLSDRDAKTTALYSLAGAGVGALAGTYLANKQRQYSAAEDQLDSMIADVRKSNDDTRQFISSARQVIAEDRRRLNEANARYAAGKSNKAELDRAVARARANREVIKKTKADAHKQADVYAKAEQDFKSTNPNTSTSGLSSELSAFRDSLNTLDEVATGLERA